MIKAIFITIFLLILISLGAALFHLVRHKSDDSSAKTVRALTIRIGLSIALFIIVVISIATGLFKPHGIGARMHLATPPTHESLK